MDDVLNEKTNMRATGAPSRIAGLRVLLIGNAANSLADSELRNRLTACLEVTVSPPAAAIKLLRERAFDAAIVVHNDGLDAVAYLPTMFAVGGENLAIVIAGERPSFEMEVRCFEAEADAYYCQTGSSVDLLFWHLHRAVERKGLVHDARQWLTHQEQAREQDHYAAVHQVRSLRSVLLDRDADPHPPQWLVKKLGELLRAYVVSVSGDLADEVRLLVGILEQSGVILNEVLMAHSVATEQLVIGLGNRPAWHVLGRSQMMAYELLMHFSKSDRSPAEALPKVRPAASV